MINCTCRSPPGRTRTHRQATQIMNTPQCSFRFCGIDLSSQSPKVLFYTTKHWTRHSGTGDWPTDLLSWAVSSIRPMVPLHPGKSHSSYSCPLYDSLDPVWRWSMRGILGPGALQAQRRVSGSLASGLWLGLHLCGSSTPYCTTHDTGISCQMPSQSLPWAPGFISIINSLPLSGPSRNSCNPSLDLAATVSR